MQENHSVLDTSEPVPGSVHERDMARMERSNRRLSLALAVVSVAAVLVIALFGVLLYKSNQKWVEAWSSYDYSSDEITVDGENNGSARYIGDGSGYYEGDYYGAGYSAENPEDAPKG